jgi:hypothetical protein
MPPVRRPRRSKAPDNVYVFPDSNEEDEEYSPRTRKASSKTRNAGKLQKAVQRDSWDGADHVVTLFKEQSTGKISGEVAWADGRENTRHTLNELELHCKELVGTV